MKKLIFFLFLASTMSMMGQRPGMDSGDRPAKKKDSVAPVDLYKIISIERDTTHLDTSLTIVKDYKFNYLQKDNFELLPFSNTGQTYNSLSLQKDKLRAFPEFGAKARHYNFMEVEDIDYYHVPTPWTRLYFKTVPEQGQQVDAFFTVNTSRNLNMFIAYKGMRALGQYQHILTSSGNLRIGFSYDSNNKRYHARGHFVSQDLMNEENGGLTNLSISQYIDKEPEFVDRAVLDVNFENAESTLYGKRFFLDHEYVLSNPNDLSNSISIGHRLEHAYKKFVFQQDAAVNSIFGESFEASNLETATRSTAFTNKVSLNFSNVVLGKLSGWVGYTNYNYGYNSVYITDENIVGNRLNGDVPYVGGSYREKIGGFNFEAEGRINISDELTGNYLMAGAGYSFNRENQLKFGISHNSTAPNFNYLLHQSDYVNYNWQNDFENVVAQHLFAELESKNLAKLKGELIQIDGFTYFGLNESDNVKPFQHNNQVRYFKVKAEKELDFGLVGMYHTLMYQNVLEGNEVLNVPDFVTRNSVYYKDHWFQKALYLQTGFTFNYFSKYNMNAYDPVLAEFYVQNTSELGGFPVVDYFFNAKVDKARIFFKLQHLNALVSGNNNFSAPGYPYADFIIRFGLVWDLFM